MLKGYGKERGALKLRKGSYTVYESPLHNSRAPISFPYHLKIYTYDIEYVYIYVSLFPIHTKPEQKIPRTQAPTSFPYHFYVYPYATCIHIFLFSPSIQTDEILDRSPQFLSRILFTYIHTGWHRVIGCLIFIGRFPQKNPMISGSFFEK